MKGSSFSLHIGAFREAQGAQQWEGDDTPKTVIYYVTVIDALGEAGWEGLQTPRADSL